MVNAYEGYGDRCPAIITGPSIGVMIVWWESSDGFLKLDGKEFKVDKLRPAIREQFVEYDPPTEHNR